MQLWLDCFVTELLWTVRPATWPEKDPVGSKELDIAPSWSWASIHGIGTSHAEKLHSSSEKAQLVTVIKFPKLAPFCHVQYQRKLGVSSEYPVTLQGSLYQCYHKVRKVRHSSCHGLHPSSESNNDELGLFNPDELVQREYLGPLYCLRIVHSAYKPYQHGQFDGVPIGVDRGLVLMPINFSEALFQRVGFLYEAGSMFDKYGSDSIAHII